MKKCICTDNKCQERKLAYQKTPCTAKIQPSTILKAGKGLFADRDYKKNEFITYYSGSVTNIPIEGDRVLQISKKSWIDASGPCVDALAPGDFLNHKLPANARFSISSHPMNLVKIIATQNVKKGSEFFIDYGPEYWNSPAVTTTRQQQDV